MAEVTKIQVRTRDRRLVPFDRDKISEGILESMASVGVGDGDLAEELSAAVAHFLHEFRADAQAGLTIGVDSIHDMVEKVLMETGHREIARSYILLREKRARIREQQSVARPAADPRAPVVESRHDRQATTWNRARIVRALMEEGELEASVAEEIAEAVEGRVTRSGLGSISTSLVRELVDNELFERGHTAGLRRQASVSLPKYDLEQLLFRGGDPTHGIYPGDPVRVTQYVGGLLLRQYVLDEVYSPEVAEAFFDGTFHLHELDRSLQILRATVRSDRLVPASQEPRAGLSSSDTGSGALFGAVFHRVRDLLPLVSEEIEVSHLEFSLLRSRGDEMLDCEACGRALLREIEEFMGILARATQSPPTVTLRVPFVPRYLRSDTADLFALSDSFSGEALEEDAAWFLVETLRQALGQPEGPKLLAACRLKFEVGPKTFAERRFREALRSVLAMLPPEAPFSFEVSVPGSEESPGQGLEEEADARVAMAVAGKVTLNLPRVALECQRASETDPEPRLRERVVTMLQAIRERADWLSRLATHPASPLSQVGSLLPGTATPPDSSFHLPGQESPSADERHDDETAEFVIGVVGLDDAVRTMCGDALHESERARTEGERWLASLRRALHAQKRPGDPLLVLEETANTGALRRFETLDCERFESSRDPKDNTYRSGVRFGRWAPLDPLQRSQYLQSYRPLIRLLDRLDEASTLRADGVDVLLAYLEEACLAPVAEPIKEKA